MQELHLSVLFHVLTLSADHFNITLQLASHQKHDLVDHLVKQVYPSEAHLCIDLVCLRIYQGLHNLFVSLRPYGMLDVLSDGSHGQRL